MKQICHFAHPLRQMTYTCGILHIDDKNLNHLKQIYFQSCGIWRNYMHSNTRSAPAILYQRTGSSILPAVWHTPGNNCVILLSAPHNIYLPDFNDTQMTTAFDN